MQNYATHCKFCHRPITVRVDDEYSIVSDPLKLLPLAACNGCADLRTERRKVESRIQFACDHVFKAMPLDDGEKKVCRDTLTYLSRQYASIIARWYQKDGGWWEEEIVEILLDRPREWGETLSRMWKMYREWERQQRQKQPDMI